MTEPEEELDPIVTRGITVSEVLDGDSEVRLCIGLIGNPSTWDQLRMLHSAILAVREDLQSAWYGAGW